MNKRPWMPLYIADYLKDTTHLGALLSGAYLHLIMDYWQNGKLPSDETHLARIARLTPHEWRRHRATLVAFFHDGWKHKRLDAELAHSIDISTKRRKIAADRQARIREQNESKPSAIAPANADTLHTSHSIKEEERKKETRASALSGDWHSAHREIFWGVWPNKVGKPAAMKALAAARKRGASFDAICCGVEAYIRDKPPDRPWLNPATFLNQNRWEDQPATVSTTNGKPRNGIIQAADDLCRKLAEFDGPAREDDELRGETGETVVRLLPNRRCE